MGEFRNVKEIERSLKGIPICEFRRVLEFRIFQDDELGEWHRSIDLTVATEDRKPNQCAKLRFRGIGGLQVDGRKGALEHVEGFDIVDKHADQWEDIKWEIIDFEQNTLHFYCRSIELLELTDVEL